jgi:intein/homing endonuclease
MTTKLKNGAVVRDPRLTRIHVFDERSRQYPIRAAIDATKPRSYTWSCGKHLNQGVEGSCFPPGTFIRMSDGSQKKIEDIKLLDTVVTAEGNIGRVTELMVRDSADKCVAVKLIGHAAIVCTKNHPILTQRGYVAAEDLLGEDRVSVTRYSPPNVNEIDIAALKIDILRAKAEGRVAFGHLPNRSSSEALISALPNKIKLTPGFGRLIGLYAAEGCASSNKTVWSFGSHEKDTLVQETVGLLKSELGVEARIQTRPNNCIKVNVYGKAWSQLFSILVPGTAKYGDKRLSSLVTAGSLEYLQALLEGWLDGDGHKRRAEQVGISVSQNLALDMHAIANKLGLQPAIRGDKPSINKWANKRQYRWTVSIPKGTERSFKRPPQTETAQWRKVLSVTPVEYRGPVYNMHVEGDESYVANGLGVHNCVGHGFAHELIARPSVVDGIDSNFAVEKIYWEAQKIDQWAGGSYPGARPQYEGTSVLAGAKVVQKLGYVKEYRWAFGLDDLIMAVGYKGPAVIGVNWYEGMQDTDSDGYISPQGYFQGGHCVLVKGVNIKDGYFTIHNSWGEDWGVKGDCRITFSDMDYLLNQDGEACIPLSRSNKKGLLQNILDAWNSILG